LIQATPRLGSATPPDLQKWTAVTDWRDKMAALEKKGRDAVIEKLNTLLKDNKKCGPQEPTQCK
jgi:hypothetical protein